MPLLLGFSLMGGGHKNDQIKCKNYDVEIEYEGKVIIGCIDFDDKIWCWQLRNSEILSPTTNCHHLIKVTWKKWLKTSTDTKSLTNLLVTSSR